MKKTLILLLLLSIFSCSSDDTSTTEEPSANFKLKKISSIQETLEFSYDGNKLINVIETENQGSVYKTELVYENNKIVRLKRFINNVYQSNNDLFFEYTDDKISVSSGYEDNILFSHQYEYNSLGQMITDAQYDDGIYNSEENFTYTSDGNIETHSHTAFSGTHTYTYDSKSNPIYYAYPLSLSKIWAISKNNYLSKNTDLTYEYEYNSENLPIEKISKLNGNIIETELFEYY